MIFIIAFIIILIIVFAVIVHMKSVANENNVKYEMMYFPNFPETFKELNLFFISDIHRRNVADSIIEEVKDLADIVIIGGDLLEKGVSLNIVQSNLQKLKVIGPVYFVWGNNDYEINHDKVLEILNEEKVTILDNKGITFHSPEGEAWSLMGVEDYSLEHDDLEEALRDVENTDFKILISHNPKIMEKINPDHHISLVLSGHTHGGQIRLFGFGPYELGGTKIIDETTLLVSNGYGTTTIPLRLGANPETHLIKIQSKKNE